MVPLHNVLDSQDAKMGKTPSHDSPNLLKVMIPARLEIEFGDSRE